MFIDPGDNNLDRSLSAQCDTSAILVRDESCGTSSSSGGLRTSNLIRNGAPSSASVLSLPFELLHQVMSHTPASSLAVLASVNHTFQVASEQVLYRCVEPSPAHIIRCLRTLHHRPQLCQHTRTLVIADTEQVYSYVTRNFLFLLSQVLRNMAHLTSLTLLLDGPHSFVLQQCPSQLKILSTTLYWNSTLTRWLSTQASLKSALFGGQYESGTLDSAALPNLARISASPLILSLTVPLRPVQEIEVCLINSNLLATDIMNTIMRILKFSKGEVRSLQIIVRLAEPRSARDISEALSVIPLVFPELDSFALHAASGAVTAEIIAGIENVLSGFQRLRSFLLLSRDDSDDLHNSAIVGGCASKWHSVCQALECVSLPGSVWIRNKRYGWITLHDLEQILSERRLALAEREAELSVLRKSSVGGFEDSDSHIEG